MKRYFDHIGTMAELKKEYRRLAMLMHPDHGGNHEEFVQMGNQYDEAVKRIEKYGETKQDREAASREVPEDFREAVNVAMACEGVVLDLVGSWLWASGNTYANKEKLRNAGFVWSTKHKKWYYNGEEDQKKRRGTNQSFDKICDHYGKQRIGTGKDTGNRTLSA